MNYAVLQLHIATFLFGLSGVIGQLNTIDVYLVVASRAGLAALGLFAWARFKGISLRTSRSEQWRYLLIGVLLAFHWTSFFLSIRLSSVAVGLLTFSCFPIFVILLGPLFGSGRIRLADFALVAVLMLGLRLVVPGSLDEAGDLAGPLWGIASGLSFAVIQLLNHALVQNEDPVKISVYQNGIASLALLPLLDASMLPDTASAIAQLVFLGLACTALAHTLFIAGMRSVGAQTASMFTYLEPVYGIALAALLLGEIPTPAMAAGGVIILGAVFFATKRQGTPAS
jgi:drug/metabolite transporter (DMT)-like permease